MIIKIPKPLLFRDFFIEDNILKNQRLEKRKIFNREPPEP